jgi:hypothetical protein
MQEIGIQKDLKFLAGDSENGKFDQVTMNLPAPANDYLRNTSLIHDSKLNIMS